MEGSQIRENELNIIRNFLWETFLIDHNKRVLEKTESCSQDEKLEILQNLVLMNLFLLRRVRDPGFFWHISRSVHEEKSNLRKLRRYVRRLVEEHAFDVEELTKIHAKDTKDREVLLEKNINQPITNPFDHLSSIEKNYVKARRNAMVYLKRRFLSTLKGNESIEARAIHSLWQEYSMNVDVRGQLLEPSSPYESSLDSESWQYLMKRFVISNIRFASVYHNKSLPVDIGLHALAPASVKLFEFVVEEILNDVLDESVSLKSPEILEYNKFANDAISIISVYWFNDKTEEEKLQILNENYPLSIGNESLDDIYRSVGSLDILISMASSLYQNGHPEEARIAYFYALSKCEDAFCRFVCHENIATTYRDQDGFRNALTHYSKALEEIRTSGCASTYQEAVELKNIGEMHSHLRQQEESKRRFHDVERRMDSLSEKERSFLLWNMACANRRTHDFEQEYDFLNRVLDLDANVIGRDVLSHVTNRLTDMNRFLNDVGDLDNESLQRIELSQRYQGFLSRGLRSLYSFQFQQAIEWFTLASRLLEGRTGALMYLGMAHMLNESYDQARQCFEKVISIDSNEAYSHTYLGILDIIGDNTERGLTHILEAILLNCESEGDCRAIVHIMTELLAPGLSDRLDGLSGEVATRLPSEEYVSLFYNNLGLEFTDMGFFAEGLDCLRKALKSSSSSENRAINLLCIGVNYQNQGLHEKAIDSFGKAISIKEDYHECLYRTSLSYAFLMNYVAAIRSIDKALEFSPDTAHYANVKKYFGKMARNVINLRGVRNEESRRILYSAERMFQNLVTERKYIDISVILVEYAKGVESMLHNEVSISVAEELKGKYGEPNGQISTKRLPYHLRMLLSDGRSISLGTWAKAFEEIDEEASNPIASDFKALLRIRFSEEDIVSLREICSEMSARRGPSAHLGTKDKDDMVSIREEVIDHTNKAIDIIYDGQ